ncbi:hypothetical protein BDQ12DRAFT_725379 [Crucibulum laeve]|uniref:CBM6 domain-containing protein n=1 Tax=Crucibulum laeve TaxID=68775 RepID=A0A5C3LU44_9AGAR|nr:hypothetical protein BDQ12DRAFT_725379 [Crucibulum laeve]
MYGQLPAVPGTTATLNAWQAINSNITVVKETTPVLAALPNALQLTVPSTNTVQVNFSNSGYFGIKVTEGTAYTASFLYRFPASSSFNGNAMIRLETASGQVVGSTTTVLSGSNTGWTQVNVTFQPEITLTDTNNLFTITLNRASALHSPTNPVGLQVGSRYYGGFQYFTLTPLVRLNCSDSEQNPRTPSGLQLDY